MPLQPCECVPGSPPWKQIPDIIAAVKSVGGADDPDRTCYEGLTLSEQLTEWYCALDGIINPEFDPDALNFFERAEITNSAQKDAVNTLVLDMKSTGLWDKFTSIYPFVGGTELSNSQNLKSSDYTITWVGGLTHSSTGVVSVGGTGHIGALNPALLFTNNLSWHIGAYLRNQPAPMGVNGSILNGASSSAFSHSGLSRYNDGGTNVLDLLLGSQIAFTLGFAYGARTGSGADLLRKEGGIEVAGALPDFNWDNAVGSTVIFANIFGGDLLAGCELSFLTTGEGLSSAERSDFEVAVTTYQTALGRAV